jgi:hypothetical protein
MFALAYREHCRDFVHLSADKRQAKPKGRRSSFELRASEGKREKEIRKAFLAFSLPRPMNPSRSLAKSAFSSRCRKLYRQNPAQLPVKLIISAIESFSAEGSIDPSRFIRGVIRP